MMTGKLAATALMVGLAMGGASCHRMKTIKPSAEFADRNPIVERCAKVLPVKVGKEEFSVEKKRDGDMEAIRFGYGFVRTVTDNGVNIAFTLPNEYRMVTVTLPFGESISITDGAGNSGDVIACSGANGEVKLAGDVARHE